jgi:hypothetical protein
MKKGSETHSSRALILPGNALPAATVSVADETWSAFDEDLRKKLMKARSDEAVTVARFGFATTSVLMTLMVPMAIMSGVGACILPVVVYGGMAGIATKAQADAENLLPRHRKLYMEQAKEKFHEAQKAAYNEQKRLIAAAAEQHLGRGNLLTLEDAAFLSSLNADDVRKSTYQLAITVLQIRKLLAQARGAAGDAAIENPETFASNRLRPEADNHRKFLYEILREHDAPIAEDDLPVLQEPEIEGEAGAQIGYGKAFLKLLNPLSGRRLKREFKQAKVLRFKPVDVAGVRPAADFAAALAAYESRNPPLDLPAVRGWGGGRRKALPAPGAGL